MRKHLPDTDIKTIIMEMEKYSISVTSEIEYLTTSYELEVVSIYGVRAHLYALAAIYEYVAAQIIDNIQDGYLAVIIGNKTITYQAKII